MEKKIESLVLGMGLKFVTMNISSSGTLQVFIDRADRSVSTDDCELVSRQLARVLAVEDFQYNRLEVSSPGLEKI